MPPLITALPPAPGPDRPTTLETDTQAFLNGLAGFVPETNTLAAWMETTAAGLTAGAAPSGVIITDTFNGASTAGDPGTGKLSFDNLTQASATKIRINNTDNLGVSTVGRVNLFDDTTSTRKGFVRIFKALDPSKWWVAGVLSITAQTGYFDVTIDPTTVVVSGANPFTSLDLLTLSFTPNGDAGVSLFTDAISQATISSAVASVVIGPFPADKGEVEVRVGLTLSASASLRATFSTDNVTYTATPFSAGLSANVFAGYINIRDATGARSVVEMGQTTGSAWPTSPDATTLAASVGAIVALTGGVKYLKLTPSTGNINSGTIYPVRVR